MGYQEDDLKPGQSEQPGGDDKKPGNKQKKQRKKRKLDPVMYETTTKIFQPKGPAIEVEFLADDSESSESVGLYLKDLRQKREFPNLDECAGICSLFGVRARVNRLGQYIGHLFEDGTTSKDFRL